MFGEQTFAQLRTGFCLLQFCGDRASSVLASFTFVVIDPSSGEERLHRLSVLGAHAVVHVEGGVDVVVDLQEPERCEERVLVAASRV